MRYRLLVVEPDWTTASGLCSVFDASRFAIYWARDLAASRSAIARFAPLDLVVLDPALPDGDGLVLCAALKAIRPSLPVVVLAEEEETRARALEAHADRVVDKVAVPSDLRAAVERLLQPAPRRRRASS